MKNAFIITFAALILSFSMDSCVMYTRPAAVAVRPAPVVITPAPVIRPVRKRVVVVPARRHRCVRNQVIWVR